MSGQPPAVVALLGVGVVSPGDPIVVADDLGLTRGDGCFDATRVRMVDGLAVVDHLDEHLDRFCRSAGRLGLTVDRAAWQELIDDALAAWDGAGTESTLKLILTAGSEADTSVTGLVMIIPASPELSRSRQGLNVVTLARNVSSKGFTDAPWLLGGVKTISYALNRAAAREAARRGGDEALWVSLEGHLLEGPTSTLVVLQRDRLVTPESGPAGTLPSITQHVIFARAASIGLDTAQTDLTTADVLAADGAWLVSSVRGVVPILSLDGTAIAQRPEVTGDLRRLAGF